MFSIKFKNSKLFYLDQTKLPQKEVWKECKNVHDGFLAIKELQVRGAPLIGVFAAYCIAVYAKNLNFGKERFLKELKRAITGLKLCRPTAVNLAWALEELESVILKNTGKSINAIKDALLKEAQKIYKQDIELCGEMASYGIKLIKSGDSILTHCNAGFLATAGEGTALSLIYKAQKIYKNIKVYADETRPLLQGARLTAWELSKRKINCTLICDNMAAFLMQKGKIDKIFVGADRIAANGDVANKIGTYGVAVAANYHKVPFYVVAPFSTFDLSLSSGKQIPIEERAPGEVRTVLGKIDIAPKNIKVFNPAFDITPSKLITAIVSDRGVIYPPFDKNIKNLFSKNI
ncbi:MAG: S-methyl-5-thioribose-1-phosphate isomerase [Candidatus Omnitrophota bacterium]